MAEVFDLSDLAELDDWSLLYASAFLAQPRGRPQDDGGALRPSVEVMPRPGPRPMARP